MNPLISVDDVWDKPTEAAEWRAKLPDADEVNSKEQDD